MIKNFLTYLLLVFPVFVFAQNLDLETFRKPSPLKIRGGLSANAVFYDSDQQNSREPFTYFLQGNLNLSLYDFSVPISYSYSNQGDRLGYQLPFNLNRLSLHPKYKWITGHIGDVNMTFSPYTLNGHQFTGAGVDVVPGQGFTFSAMYGRFLKATEADENPGTVASYKRVGYGFKTSLEKKWFSIGFSGFYAIDRENSIGIDPDGEGILPKENLVLGFEGGVSLTEDLQLKAEYATTAITQDTRAVRTDGGKRGLLGGIFNNRASTEYYKAYKVALQYSLAQASLGVGYERVDPGYETLGAYFFNNDFENITVDVISPFFDNKLNLGFSIGYQKDNLDNQKANPTNRFVGSVNASFNASERLNLTASYSNFSTYTNIRVDQFDTINDDDLLDNVLDTLNYRQVSQNANLNINYVLSHKKSLQQQINVNYNVSDVSNEQGGVVRIGDASTFHNLATAYTLGFPERDLNITPAVNATYNTIGLEDATTWGPTLSINKGFLDHTLNTVLSTSYNTTSNATGNTDITNIRVGVSYILWKRHNLNFNAVQLFRNGPVGPDLSEFTGTFGYNYSFDVSRQKRDGIKKAKGLKKKQDKGKDGVIKINYRKYHFVGTPTDITEAILAIIDAANFVEVPADKELELKALGGNLQKAIDKKENVYRENAIAYLKSLDALQAFEEKYRSLVAMAYYKLILEAEDADDRLQKEFIRLNAENNDPDIKKTLKFKENLAVVNTRYKAHKKMLKGLKDWNILENTENKRLGAFKNANRNRVYAMFQEGRDEDEMVNFMEYRLADLYHSQAEH